jgi:hypothetical protein
LSLNGGGLAGLYEPWVREFEQRFPGIKIKQSEPDHSPVPGDPPSDAQASGLGFVSLPQHLPLNLSSSQCRPSTPDCVYHSFQGQFVVPSCILMPTHPVMGDPEVPIGDLIFRIALDERLQMLGPADAPLGSSLQRSCNWNQWRPDQVRVLVCSEREPPPSSLGWQEM